MYDFVYVDNVALAHVLAVEALLKTDPTTAESPNGKAFFITNAEPVPFREFLLSVWREFDGPSATPWSISVPPWLAYYLTLLSVGIAKVTGNDPLISVEELGDSMATRYFDNSRAREILGYKPAVALAEGVKRTCDDYKTVLAERSTQQ